MLNSAPARSSRKAGHMAAHRAAADTAGHMAADRAVAAATVEAPAAASSGPAAAEVAARQAAARSVAARVRQAAATSALAAAATLAAVVAPPQGRAAAMWAPPAPVAAERRAAQPGPARSGCLRTPRPRTWKLADLAREPLSRARPTGSAQPGRDQAPGAVRALGLAPVRRAARAQARSKAVVRMLAGSWAPAQTAGAQPAAQAQSQPRPSSTEAVGRSCCRQAASWLTALVALIERRRTCGSPASADQEFVASGDTKSRHPPRSAPRPSRRRAGTIQT